MNTTKISDGIHGGISGKKTFTEISELQEELPAGSLERFKDSRRNSWRNL